MPRHKFQAENKALLESGVNLISSDYDEIIELWLKLVTERQRVFVESRPLVKIEASTDRRKKRTQTGMQTAAV